MNDLTYSQTDSGLEVVILKTGEAFCPQFSYSRWVGKAQSTISERCSKLEIVDLESFKAPIGFPIGALIKTKLPLSSNGGLQEAILVPAKIFGRWLAKDNPELFDEAVEAGATQFLYSLAGYQLKAVQKETEIVETKAPLALDQEIRLVVDLLPNLLINSGIDPKLANGVALNYLGLHLPSAKDSVNEAHKLLAASNETDLLLTPTKIGKELNLSAVKVNNLLMALGYQVKNLSKKSKTEPDYFPTDLGKPYAGNTLATRKLQKEGADNTSYQHLKWKAEIIDILREQLKEV